MTRVPSPDTFTRCDADYEHVLGAGSRSAHAEPVGRRNSLPVARSNARGTGISQVNEDLLGSRRRCLNLAGITHLM